MDVEGVVSGGVFEEVGGGDGVEEGAAVVADDDFGFVGGVAFSHFVGEVAEGSGLAGFAFAEDEEEGGGFEVGVDGFEVGFVEPDGDAAVGRSVPLGRWVAGTVRGRRRTAGGASMSFVQPGLVMQWLLRGRVIRRRCRLGAWRTGR